MQERFIDESPRTGLYEGDLKYGRCLEAEPKKRQDFAAERHNGVATNRPVVSLVLIEQRNPKFWRKDPQLKTIKKRINNPPQVADEVLRAILKNPHGLASHITSVKLGARLLKGGA